jgi:hypothetical protein
MLNPAALNPAAFGMTLPDERLPDLLESALANAGRSCS